jgi:protein-tyrosine-phosphatase
VPNVVFVCLHGSAKSVIAAEHFNRLADARGLELHAESAGIEPDADLPEHVIKGLASDGIDVRGYRPRAVSAEVIERASHIVSFGCDLIVARPSAYVEQWTDVPMVSDGFVPARNAIVARVEQLLNTLT